MHLRAPIIACLAAFAWAVAASAATLTSNDGKTRDFPIVVSASPKGLTVRESTQGKDILIPWERLDLTASAQKNPWLKDARAKAQTGETVALGSVGALNSGGSASQPAAPVASEWRTSKSTVKAGDGQNFTALSLSAYIHREVTRPTLAIVWVGGPSPLASRADAADFARRMSGALVVADFSGDYLDAAEGSGEALVNGVTELLAHAPGPVGARPPESKKDRVAIPPAMIVIGQDHAASFVWSLVCARPGDVLVAATIDGKHLAQPNAQAFATPVLFLQTTAAALTTAGTADPTRPLDLWRQFSTDGSHWCFAATPADPLALAVAFAREVAAASPYQEVIAQRDKWENDPLKGSLPLPVRSFKEMNDEGFRLAPLDGSQTYEISAKTGEARNDLVWVPSDAFAKRLAEKARP